MDIDDQVMCIDSSDTKKLCSGIYYTIDDIRHERGVLELHFEELSGRNWYKADRFKLQANNQAGGSKVMNKAISNVFGGDGYDTTVEMDKEFGNEVPDNFTGELALVKNKKAYTDELAKRKTDKADAAHKAAGGDVADAFVKMANKS